MRRLMEQAFAAYDSSLPQAVVVMTERKKKRRRGRILFSSRKQLQRARMGKRKGKLSEVLVSDTARVLSYDEGQSDSDGERQRSSKKEGLSNVRLYFDEFIFRLLIFVQMPSNRIRIPLSCMPV
jgi:hypothetical protein